MALSRGHFFEGIFSQGTITGYNIFVDCDSRKSMSDFI